MDSSAAVTGKSPWNRGVQGRIQSSGIAVYYILRDLMFKDGLYKKLRAQAKLAKGLEGKKVIIQGFGTVGYWAAVYLKREGAIIQGVVTGVGSIYNEEGINPEKCLNALNSYKDAQAAKTGKAAKLAKAIKKIEKIGVFTLDESVMYKRCDILIPCALEMAIHTGNVDQIKAKLVIEGANGAVSFAAAQYFYSKEIVVVPDILAGTGSLIASYYEYLCNIDKRTQSLTITRWEEKSKLTLLANLQAVFKKANFNVDFEKMTEEYMKGPEEIDLLFGLIETCITTS
jgi:glutamate dehydrogenase (NAD(P)+)